MWKNCLYLSMIVTSILIGIYRPVKSEYQDDSILCEDIKTICTINKLKYHPNPQHDCDKLAKNGDILIAYDSPEICNCGLTCIKNLDEGSACKHSHTWGFPDEICGAMLSCLPVESLSTNYTCQKDPRKQCVNEVIKYDQEKDDGTLGPGRSRPNCNDIGQYAGKQCTPGTTCYCANKEGNRLFGEETFSLSDNMTCDCSNFWVDNESKGLNIGMRCTSDGNFDSLQCFDDVCYCFDPSTMELTHGPLHITMLTQMKCFNKNYHFNDYYNPCERNLLKHQDEILTGEIHIEVSDRPICNPDGYYSAIQKRGINIFCSDIYGHQIEEYITPFIQSDDVNCNCARRRALLMSADETDQLPKCENDGNFKPRQSNGILAYCVDLNGNQIGKSVPVTDTHTLHCK